MTTAEKQAPPKAHRRVSTYIIFFLALIALSTTYLTLKTMLQARQVASQQMENLTTQVNTLKQQQLHDKMLFAEVLKSLKDSQKEVQQKLSDAQKNIGYILRQRTHHLHDSTLLKVKYYLELAEINANWSQETESTAALLKQADTLLASMPGTDALPLRQAIAKELADIKAMPKLDLTGILSQLDGAIQSVHALPLKTMKFPEPSPERLPVDSTSGWRDRLRNSIGPLRELVVIRHHQDDVEPLPSKAEEALLREEMRLNLQQAQWALLQRNDALFHTFLRDALQQLTQSFATDAEATKSLLQLLTSLQKTQIIQQRPSIEPSLKLINQWIETSSEQVATSLGANKS